MNCPLSARMTPDKCRSLRISGQSSCLGCESAGEATRSVLVQIPLSEYPALSKLADDAEQTVNELLADLAGFVVRGRLRLAAELVD